MAVGVEIGHGEGAALGRDHVAGQINAGGGEPVTEEGAEESWEMRPRKWVGAPSLPRATAVLAARRQAEPAG